MGPKNCFCLFSKFQCDFDSLVALFQVMLAVTTICTAKIYGTKTTTLSTALFLLLIIHIVQSFSLTHKI
jgi:hypothetical protein